MKQSIKTYHYKQILVISRILSFLFILLLFSYQGRAEAQEAPNAPEVMGSISGRVTTEDGQPLPGIIISSYRNRSSFYKTVMSDGDGNYRMDGLATGLYALSFSDAEGRYFREYFNDNPSIHDAHEFSVIGNDILGIDASLAKAGKIGGNISIVPGFGAGSASVRLERYQGTYGWSSVADSNVSVKLGEQSPFQFDQLPAGIYRISAYLYSSNLSSEYYDNALSAETATKIDLPAGGNISDITILLGENPNSVEISGKVTDEFGVPVPDIAVTAYRPKTEDWQADDWQTEKTTRTKNDGTYQFLQLFPVDHLIRFHDEAGKYVAEYYDNATTPSSAIPLHLVSGTIQSDVNVQLVATGIITGSIQFFDGTAPDSVSLEVYSASNGYSEPIYNGFGYSGIGESLFYQIPRLTPDTYRLSARAQYQFEQITEFYGGSPTVEQASNIVVSAGLTTTDINFSLGDSTKAAKINGSVRDERGNPLNDIEVRAYYSSTFLNPSIVTHTNQSGNYQLFMLQPGEYSVYFSDKTENFVGEYYDDTTSEFAKPLQVITGNVYPNINAILSTAGSISGTITMFNGIAPENGLNVSLYRQTNSSWEKIDSADVNRNYGGTDVGYWFRGISPGFYRVGVDSNIYGGDRMSEFYDDKPTLESATDISITSGLEVTNVNFVLSQDRANAAIEGKTFPWNEFSQNIRVELYEVSDSGYNSLLVYITPNSDGTFKIAGLDAGTYRVATCFFDQYNYCAVRIYWPNAQYPKDARLIHLDSTTDFKGIDFTIFRVHLPIISNQSDGR